MCFCVCNGIIKFYHKYMYMYMNCFVFYLGEVVFYHFSVNIAVCYVLISMLVVWWC